MGEGWAGGQMEPERGNEVRIRDDVGEADTEALVAGIHRAWGGIWRPAQMEASLHFSHPSLLHARAPTVL